MAKFTPGPTVAAVSGSIGGTTYSRNRYGAYMRFRAIPVKSTTEWALAAKARLASTAATFQALTLAQRLAWEHYAATNPIIDRLGNSQTLSGSAAYIGLNCRLASIGGTPIIEPPITTAPAALLSLSQTADIGAGTFHLTYTASPLGAGCKLFIQSAIRNSAGVNYVANLLRLVGVSAAAQASPFTHETLVSDRLGLPVAGQTITSLVSVVDTASGLLSRPLRADTLVLST